MSPKFKGDKIPNTCVSALTIAASLLTGFTCLILAGAPATAEAKTAQECYKEDSQWTVSCGALEGPQKLRDDCFSAADRRLERCLDAASTKAQENLKPGGAEQPPGISPKTQKLPPGSIQQH